MKVVLTICWLLLISTCAVAQSNEYKNELAKYYVAYFELKTAINYKNRLVEVDETFKDYYIGGYLETELISDNYRAIWYIDYLGYDVFLVYDNSTHPTPYIIGINDSLDVIKLSGFSERQHALRDSSAFRQFNDPIEAYQLGLYKKPKAHIDAFVELTVRLTNSSDHPNNVALESNEYQITDKRIIGNCKIIVELKPVYDFEDIDGLIQEWEYVIPDTGEIQFILVGTEEVLSDEGSSQNP